MTENLPAGEQEPNEGSPLLHQNPLGPDLEGLRGVDATNAELEFVVESTGVALVEEAMGNGSSPQGAPSNGPETEEARWLRESKLKHSKLAWYYRPSLSLLCFTVALMSLAETMVASPSIILTTQKVCQGISPGSPDSPEEARCDMPKAQSTFSSIQSAQMLIQGIVGTLLAGKLGELSDRFGRKPIFQYVGCVRLVSLLAIVYTILPSTPYSKWKIILANSIQALSGGLMLTIANGNSYITDCTEPKDRTIAISMLMSTIYACIGTGPLIGSAAIKLSNGNNYMPFVIAVMFITFFTIFTTIFLTESRHVNALRQSQTKFRDRRRSFESVLTNTSSVSVTRHGRYQALKFLDLLSPLKKMWLPPSVHGSLIPRYTVLILVALDVLFIISTTGMVVPLVLFATYKYRWDSVHLGYFISFIGIGRAMVLLILSPLFLHVLKKMYTRLDNSVDAIDLMSLRTAMFSVVISIAAILLWDDTRGLVLLVFAVFQNLSAFFSPTLQATLVKYCSKSSLGELFGAIALVRSATMLVFPPILLLVYAHTNTTKPKIFMTVPLLASILAFILTFMLHIVTDSELLRRPSQASLAPSSQPAHTNKGSKDQRMSTSRTSRKPSSI
ncbi:uncharacterized protein KLTH0F04862g [Lachancea thermotolerans CBS 6340]|uniref:KLTH0F04862p n=1 Tax=Lachancea thermotolerans (strain ATCC 56472 / CBS 6340 / NRRL Y-8284) TaxID=559295 RepID=C5DKI2_LACTC|nr:KLTH0F04862p [Lachancea thermotolerans CBS 6340]CAR23983.1 KLTH0F04862p [Lachancea thermotolerans CBS 6340]